MESPGLRLSYHPTRAFGN